MNVKFFNPLPKTPLQRNSYMSLQGFARPPPGFENSAQVQPSGHAGFVANSQFAEFPQRGKSPPNQNLRAPLTKRMPMAKRSQQNVVKPLVAGPDGFNLYKDLDNQKFGSDSLSDDSSDNIKEEENDDTEEEKNSKLSIPRHPKAKLSSDNISKLLFLA